MYIGTVSAELILVGDILANLLASPPSTRSGLSWNANDTMPWNHLDQASLHERPTICALAAETLADLYWADNIQSFVTLDSEH